MTTAAQRIAFGHYGERVAARRLRQAGMVILDRNWRGLEGELDIVAQDGPTLVICEVKARRSQRYGHPLESIDDAKLERMMQLAHRWMKARQREFAAIRLDVVAIIADGHGAPEVEHIRGLG